MFRNYLLVSLASSLWGCTNQTDSSSVPVAGSSGTGGAGLAQSVAGAPAGGSGSGPLGGNSAMGGGGGGSLGGIGTAGLAGGGGNGEMVTVTRPSINGTVLWLEAADVASVSLEGDRVAAWRDSSGLHNDAIQNSDAVRPTLVSEATKVPVLHFGAMRHTFLGVPDAETLRFGTDDFTVAAVFGHNNQPFPEGSQGVHLGGWAFVVNKITQPSGPRIGWGLMGNWPNGEQSPVRTAVGCETTEAGGVVLTKDNGYADGALRLWVMHRDTAAGLVELRENGVVANSAKGGPYLDSVDNVGTAITIGGARLNPNNQNSAGFSLDGDVAAIVAVKGPISAVALGELEGYLLKRYELAPK